ncbi:MAG: hypothetical protein AAGA46_02870 [Cyanobacteria bacterium P01_F01_bin.13]
MPSNCGCGSPAVQRRVLAEDADNIYVSETGEAGKAYDAVGENPFTSPDGKPLQRLPKDKYITSMADRMGELTSRAQEKIGNLSQEISPNYRSEDIEQHDDHHQSGNMSVRRANHRGKEIVVKTYYEVTIDGELFENHLMVDDRGRVHCHGLPNYAYPSMMDLLKRLIDADLELSGERPSSNNNTDHNTDHHHGGHH